MIVETDCGTDGALHTQLYIHDAPVYLGDGVDPGDVGEDVRPPRGVVHDRLDAAERGRVDGGLRAVPVQPRQQAQQTGEALAGEKWRFISTAQIM